MHSVDMLDVTQESVAYVLRLHFLLPLHLGRFDKRSMRQGVLARACRHRMMKRRRHPWVRQFTQLEPPL